MELQNRKMNIKQVMGIPNTAILTLKDGWYVGDFMHKQLLADPKVLYASYMQQKRATAITIQTISSDYKPHEAVRNAALRASVDLSEGIEYLKKTGDNV